MTGVETTGVRRGEPDARPRKLRAVLFVGYHYLSTPMYLALRKQLKHFELFYVLPKDTIGSDTNYKHFDRESFRRDPNYVELGYDPPWFRGLMPWHVRGKWNKLVLWMRWVLSFYRFKREILRLVSGLQPDLIITTSDLFFTPRYVAAKMPHIPMALLQPCYLDLWERPRRFPVLKRLVNTFQPHLFERQEYFGLEIDRAELLVWESAAQETYGAKGRRATRIVNPAHIDIRDNARAFRQRRAELLRKFDLPADARVLSVFPAYYGDVVGHGREYQRQLEQGLVAALARLAPHFGAVVKIHPNEDMAYWQRVFAPLADTSIRLVHNIERFQLMAVSDYLVSTNSYAAVEATLSGTVAINFVPGIDIIGPEFCAPFSRHAAVACTTVEELVRTILDAQRAGGPDALRHAVAAAQERVLGQKSGVPTAEDVFLRLITSCANQMAER